MLKRPRKALTRLRVTSKWDPILQPTPLPLNGWRSVGYCLTLMVHLGSWSPVIVIIYHLSSPSVLLLYMSLLSILPTLLQALRQMDLLTCSSFSDSTDAVVKVSQAVPQIHCWRQELRAWELLRFRYWMKLQRLLSHTAHRLSAPVGYTTRSHC